MAHDQHTEMITSASREARSLANHAPLMPQNQGSIISCSSLGTSSPVWH